MVKPRTAIHLPVAAEGSAREVVMSEFLRSGAILVLGFSVTAAGILVIFY